MKDYFNKLFTPLTVGFEKENEFHDERIWNVKCPGYYSSINHKGNTMAVVIVPGGAYWKLNPLRNGFNFQEKLDEIGIDSFVLLHSLPHQKELKEGWNAPMEQCHSLINILKPHYNHVGILGVSAGGHVAAMTPADFAIIFSPVISMRPKERHENTAHNLLGDKMDDARYAHSFSADEFGSPKTSILFHALNDEKVSVKHSIMYYEFLMARRCQAEMHLMQTGGHELCEQTHIWIPIVKKWIQINKLSELPF